MRATLIATLVAAALVVSSAAWADLFGAADAAAYQELVAIYKQLQEQYKVMIDQLKKAEEVSGQLRRAQEGYERLRNFDLKKAVSRAGYDGTGLGKADELGKAGALRREIERMKGSVEGDIGFVDTQMKKIQDLERLEMLQKANESNTEASAEGLNPGQAAAVQAQSTATLAALAAEAAAERKEDEIRRHQAAQRQARDVGNDLDMLRALGERGERQP